MSDKHHNAEAETDESLPDTETKIEEEDDELDALLDG